MASNLGQLRRDYLDSTTIFSLGEKILPYLPSHEVVDRVGMVSAIMTLGVSLRPGDYCQNVQFDTACKAST